MVKTIVMYKKMYYNTLDFWKEGIIMEKFLVFGHVNPDTDSVTASITLANLKRKLGINAEERVLGNINKETRYVLDYFKVKEPRYLNDTKLRIKDMEYRKNCFINENSSIEETYKFMLDKNTTGVPIIDKNKRFINLVTAKDILKKSIYTDDTSLYTSYDNLLKTLNGEEIVRVDDEIRGNIVAAAFAHSTFENNITLTSDDIIIVGDRHYIIDLAIKSKIKLLIIIGGNEIKKEHIKLAKKNKVNIIKTNLNTFETSRIILNSNYIKKLCDKDNSYIIHEKDSYDDFMDMSKNLLVDNYPVVDKNGICKGLLRKSELPKSNKRKVILVDHNEIEQSAIGLEEAEIVEIVDHHKIGRVSTRMPINFRNMTVGSTNTIIYQMYKENKIKISKEMAGLMISGILSDTLILKSPTTTMLDELAVKELNKICKLKINEYGINMFKAGTSLEGMGISDILNQDSKSFKNNDVTFMVSQIFTLDVDEILNNKDEYLKVIEEYKLENRMNAYIFIVTDIIKNGSYIMYDNESEDAVKKAFNLKKVYEGVFVKNIVSRKKQVVPVLIDALDK